MTYLEKNIDTIIGILYDNNMMITKEGNIYCCGWQCSKCIAYDEHGCNDEKYFTEGKKLLLSEIK